MNSSSIKASFSAGGGGFVAALNSRQVEEIKRDISVKTVEKHIGKALQVLRNELRGEKLVSIGVLLISTILPYI